MLRSVNYMNGHCKIYNEELKLQKEKKTIFKNLILLHENVKFKGRKWDKAKRSVVQAELVWIYNLLK